MRLHWIAGLLMVAMLASVSPAQAKAAGSKAAHPEFLVSTQWLAQHLSDANLVIIHAGSSDDDYNSAHIPGARHLATNKFTEGPTPPNTELLPSDKLQANLEAIGVSDDSRIIIYASDWDPFAARLFFTLDYLGRAGNAALLDGGLDMWIHEKRPLSTDVPTVAPGKLTVQAHPEVVARMDWVKQVSADPAAAHVLLTDARPLRRYRGGHIPGAVPGFWEKTQLAEETPLLRSPQELAAMFARLGYKPGYKVVSYCEVGWQASFTYFVARYLGYDAAMYDGSWTEWSTAKQPAVRGD